MLDDAYRQYFSRYNWWLGYNHPRCDSHCCYDHGRGYWKIFTSESLKHGTRKIFFCAVSVLKKKEIGLCRPRINSLRCQDLLDDFRETTAVSADVEEKRDRWGMRIRECAWSNERFGRNEKPPYGGASVWDNEWPQRRMIGDLEKCTDEHDADS